MGWTGQESYIPLGFFFRTMHCGNCATKLKKERLSRTFRKNSFEFSKSILNNRTIGMSAIQKTSYLYRCPNCGKKTTYEEQLLIEEKQNFLHSKKIVKDKLKQNKNNY